MNELLQVELFEHLRLRFTHKLTVSHGTLKQAAKSSSEEEGHGLDRPA